MRFLAAQISGKIYRAAMHRESPQLQPEQLGPEDEKTELPRLF